MPSTNGSASGLRSSAWNTTPATESDAPTSAPTATRGSRMRRTMSAAGPVASGVEEHAERLAQRHRARSPREPERDRREQHERERAEHRDESRGSQHLHGATSGAELRARRRAARARASRSARSRSGPGSVTSPASTATTRPFATAGSDGQRAQNAAAGAGSESLSRITSGATPTSHSADVRGQVSASSAPRFCAAGDRDHLVDEGAAPGDEERLALQDQHGAFARQRRRSRAARRRACGGSRRRAPSPRPRGRARAERADRVEHLVEADRVEVLDGQLQRLEARAELALLEARHDHHEIGLERDHRFEARRVEPADARQRRHRRLGARRELVDADQRVLAPIATRMRVSDGFIETMRCATGSAARAGCREREQHGDRDDAATRHGAPR